MSVHVYSITDDLPGRLDHPTLTAEIAAASIGPALVAIETGGDECLLRFDAALSSGEVTMLDGVVAAHAPPYKPGLIAQVKAWRNYKIESVLKFEHPASSGNLFAVGFVDQHNWHALYTIRETITYPYEIRTHDDAASFLIGDTGTPSVDGPIEVAVMFDQVVASVKAEIDAARDAIGKVVDAADQATAEAAANAYVGS